MNRLSEFANKVLDGGRPIDDELVNEFLGLCGPEEMFTLARRYLMDHPRPFVRRREEQMERARSLMEKASNLPTPRPAPSQMRRSKKVMAKVASLARAYRPVMDDIVTLNGDGDKALWGDMTIEQHEERIQYLLAGIEGATKAVDRHRRAIEDLRSTGANTLREMEEMAPPPEDEGEEGVA